MSLRNSYNIVAEINLRQAEEMKSLDTREKDFFLYAAGMNPKATGNNARAAMMEIMANGTNINICDDYGRTPLMYAIFVRDNANVAFLMKNGAKANLRALDVAREYGNEKALRIISAYRNFGEKINSL